MARNFAMLSISKLQDGRWGSYDEEDADCRLFAVAQELLESLKEAVLLIGDKPTADKWKQAIAAAEAPTPTEE